MLSCKEGLISKGWEVAFSSWPLILNIADPGLWFFLYLSSDTSFRTMILRKIAKIGKKIGIKVYWFYFYHHFCIDPNCLLPMTSFVNSSGIFLFFLLTFCEVVLESKIAVVWLVSRYHDTILCQRIRNYT